MIGYGIYYFLTKLMFNKIFLEFMIFDKTIDFVKVLTDNKTIDL
jgi:hypothetical protein